MANKLYFIISSVLWLPAAIRASATCQDGNADTLCLPIADVTSTLSAVQTLSLERRQASYLAPINAAATPAGSPSNTQETALTTIPIAEATQASFPSAIIIDTSSLSVPAETSQPAVMSATPKPESSPSHLLEIVMPIIAALVLIILTIILVLLMRRRYRKPRAEKLLEEDWPELTNEKAARFSVLSILGKPLPKAPSSRAPPPRALSPVAHTFEAPGPRSPFWPPSPGTQTFGAPSYYGARSPGLHPGTPSSMPLSTAPPNSGVLSPWERSRRPSSSIYEGSPALSTGTFELPDNKFVAQELEGSQISLVRYTVVCGYDGPLGNDEGG